MVSQIPLEAVAADLVPNSPDYPTALAVTAVGRAHLTPASPVTLYGRWCDWLNEWSGRTEMRLREWLAEGASTCTYCQASRTEMGLCPEHEHVGDQHVQAIAKKYGPATVLLGIPMVIIVLWWAVVAVAHLAML